MNMLLILSYIINLMTIHSVTAFVVEELGIFSFPDTGLHLIDRLLNKHSVLHIEDSISIALKLWVVGHHHASGACVLSFPAGTDAVDVKKKVHHRDYLRMTSD